MATAPSSHLVLARKWRPERFTELAGQEHVTRTLVQAIKSGRIAHAFLFTGIRGVGKTTAARILARCLNCEQGPTAEPCGECASCLEVRAGSALDVIEIDGATYRKIDDARAIIENLSYRPARDRFKIYIIDEAHQLTDQAFNALLKTLEEPPPHVKFILATTEPQKVPETILSRLQRYDFRRIPFTIILARLKELSGREGIGVDEAALSLLAREAGGSMRDAERMLETAIASLEGKVGESEVASILGVASRSRVFELTGAILNKDASVALTAVRELHRRGANLESLGRDLLQLLRDLAIAKLPGSNGPQSPLADLPDQEASEVRRLAASASGRDFMRLFRLMADAQEQLLRSPYPDLLLEMAVIRMATLAPVLDADDLMRAIGSSGPTGTSAPGATTPQAAPAGNAPSAAPAQTGARRIPISGEVKADAPRRVTAVAQPTPASVTPPTTAIPAARPTPTVEVMQPSGNLAELREFIRARRAALAGFMEQGAALQLNGDVLTVTPLNDIYIRYLNDNRNVIAELASELYGRKIRAELAPLDKTAADRTDGAPAAVAPTAVATSSSPTSVGPAPASPQTSNPISNNPISNSPASNPGANEAIPESRPATPADAAASGGPPKTQGEARQALYADPVARRIFAEFEARLVEVRVPPAPSPAPVDEPEAED
jgi:DNA polymerase-3 subunit gamma/tau